MWSQKRNKRDRKWLEDKEVEGEKKKKKRRETDDIELIFKILILR